MEESLKFLALLGAVAGLGIGAWRWAGRIEKSLLLQGQSIKSILAFQETLLTILGKSQLLKPEEYREIISTLFQGHRNLAEAAVESLKGGNPLTQDEVNRLLRYKDKLANKEDFTADEARDFHYVTHKARDEHPELDGLHVLLGIAAFLLGYFAGKKD